MYEVNKLQSFSLFVGMGKCNARCTHCAGVIHRKYAPKKDGVVDEELFSKTIEYCYSQGAKSLSISSSGEPTLSPLAVTRTFEILEGYRKKGISFSPINLYSNGIRIGEDEEFCDTYLRLWQRHGLTFVYVTVHDTDEVKNAKTYGIETYPPLERVISKIHDAGLRMRANLVLSKSNINTCEKFVSLVKGLKCIGVDYISAWPIRDVDDRVDSNLSPLEEELNKMGKWVENNSDDNIRLLGKEYRVIYDIKKKLTLFPDGTLSNTWCN